MPIATGSRVQLGYVAETTFGTTPTTPALLELPFKSFTADTNPQTLTDDTISATRQRQSARRGNTSVDGTLDVVFAPDTYDAFLESAFMGTFTTNVLRVGTTRKSFAIEECFADLTQYRVFNGIVVDSFKLTVPTNDYVRASFGLKGLTCTALTGTSVDGSGYTAATPKNPFFHEGGNFNEGGSAIAYISAIEFTLSNNTETTYALGSTGARELGARMVDLKGKVTALFESAALYNKFINNTQTSLSFTLASGAETLTFLMPKVVYTKGSIPVNGDGPLVVELEFEAIYDTTAQTVLQVTRV